MIHGASSDPVLIKKISLKLWTLRSEIEATLQKLAKEKGRALTKEEIEVIKQEYLGQAVIAAPGNLELIDGGKSDDEEATEASAEEESSEEASEETSEETSEEGGEEDLEAEMAAAMGGGEEEETPAEDTPSPSQVKIIQRTSENVPDELINKGITLLSEIEISQISFFTSKPFLAGQSIVIEFNIPRKFVINAEVIYCRPVNIKSRVISPERLSYRAIAKFSYLKPGERTLIRNLLVSIEPDVPVAPAKAKPKVAQEDDGDDFDDLDSLDF